MLTLLLLAQITPVQPLPKGTALPPPGTEEAAVIAPIERLFAGMKAKDAALILAQVRADGRLTAASTGPDGRPQLRGFGWSEFAARFKPGAGPLLEERLVGTPAVEVDGDIAMVWSSYVFLIDGKLSHCGIDHFSMVREDGAWKVQNITWTQRTTGCAAE